MRIGELSRRSGFSRDAIRLYERSGLIRPARRETDNNYKNYPDSTILTLDVIRDAQAAGMSLEDLSLLLRQIEAMEADDFDGVAFLTQKMKEVEARITAATRFLATLQQARDALEIAPLPKD